MKIRFALSVIVLTLACFSINSVSAQTMQFCENVSSDGQAITASTLFNIDATKGGYLKILVNMPYRLGSDQVIYEVYEVDPDGQEKYDNTIYQDASSDWTWFWKEVTFYKAGRYNVFVYDRERNFITSGQVRIQYY